MHLYRSLFPTNSFLALALLGSAAFANLTYSQGFHGAAILKNPVGPDGTARAHVGDAVTATITVMNLDDFGDSVTITNIIDIVHHATGDVRTANLLLPPNTVTLGLVGGTVTETTVLPTGTVTLTNMGDFVEVTNIYIVQARDTNFTDRLLKDDAQAGGIDNHDGPGGSLIPQDFFVSFPGQIFVVQPCLQVTKTCANGIGETGLITFSGTVSNCGNTLLTNVVVSNFVNGAFVHLLGPTNMDTNTVIPFSGAYLPSDPCSPTPDTISAQGTDELGLTVMASATATCSNVITTSIAITELCPPSPVAPGAAVIFTGTVSNSGNIKLNNVTVVSDRPVPNTPVAFFPFLTNHQTLSFAASYLAPSNVCDLPNTLTVRATSVCGLAVSNSVSRICAITNSPALVVRKTCPASPVSPGATLSFSGTVSNSGNIALTNIFVVVNRPATNTAVVSFARLEIGQSLPFTGSYVVPSGLVDCSISDTLTARATDVCGRSITNSTTSACPIACVGLIGDFVWEDLNHNGIQDLNEPGISNILVQLLDCSGTIILATTNTDATGIYHFPVAPGSYIVRFFEPSTYHFTLRYQGSNTNLDSDANPANGMSACITIGANQVNNSIDAGLFRTAAIGDFVWEDLNHNGLQDTNEPGVANTTVRLLDCANNPIASFVTDGTGLYLFSGLTPGGYVVEFSPPGNFTFTTPNVGSDDTIDSDANPANGRTACVTLSSGATNRTVDAGLITNALCPATCVIGAFSDPALRSPDKPAGRNQAIWMRGISTNLVFYPEAGRWITNLDGTVQFTGTARSLTNLSSGFIVSVTLSGLQTTPPPDSPNLELDPTAYIFNGGPIDPSTWFYYTNFTGTLTGFGFWDGALISVTRFGPAFQVGEGANGKNGNFGASAWFTWRILAQPATGLLPSTGMGDFNIDIICCPSGTLGDFVWQDLNGNGIQDFAEPGVAGAIVRLLDCTNKVVLTNTTTDVAGLYHFDNLLPGSYIVQFVAPSGFQFTLPFQGADIALDSDALTNGMTRCVDLASNEVNLTIDAGLATNCPPSCVVGAFSDPAFRPPDKPPGRNQAIWMRGISTNLVFSPDPGHWIENSDGTAQFSGTVRSLTNMTSGFTVTVNLSGHRTTPPSGSPLLELDPSAYVPKGPIDPATWAYYQTFSGTLTGFGFWDGAVLTVTRNGPAFQVGFGANGKNADFGASAWFDWRIIQQPFSGLLPSTGMGDFNFDLFCCLMPRVLSFQNTSSTGRQMKIQGLLGRAYTIEGSVDMITWKPITTLLNVNGILQFADPAGNIRCFYRIQMQP